jgi:hypothetical protein
MLGGSASIPPASLGKVYQAEAMIGLNPTVTIIGSFLKGDNVANNTQCKGASMSLWPPFGP